MYVYSPQAYCREVSVDTLSVSGSQMLGFLPFIVMTKKCGGHQIYSMSATGYNIKKTVNTNPKCELVVNKSLIPDKAIVSCKGRFNWFEK